MGWSAPLLSLWEAASGASREAAGVIATGVETVGQHVLEGTHSAAHLATSAASWTVTETARTRSWAADKAAVGARRIDEEAIAGTRAAIKAVLEPGLGALGPLDRTRQSIVKRINGALDSVQEMFGDKKPEDSIQACSLNTNTKDVDADGTLVSYPDGKCASVTSKSTPIKLTEIAKAESDAYLSDSACCQALRKNGSSARTIVYVNGIGTAKEVQCATLKAIGDLTCAKVYGVYNATEGFYRDAVQTSQDRNLIFSASAGHLPRTEDGRNPAVDTLTRLIESEAMQNKSLELWAHSQGGAIASLALYDADNFLTSAGIKDGLKNVQVKSFGSAAPHWPDGPTYEHYVHVNDATPVLFGLGDNPSEDKDDAGANAKVIRFSGDPANGPFQTENPSAAIPAPKANHDMVATYLKMEKQENGGCT